MGGVVGGKKGSCCCCQWGQIFYPFQSFLSPLHIYIYIVLYNSLYWSSSSWKKRRRRRKVSLESSMLHSQRCSWKKSSSIDPVDLIISWEGGESLDCFLNSGNVVILEWIIYRIRGNPIIPKIKRSTLN